MFCLALVFAQNFQLLWLKFWMNWTETKWSIGCTLVRLNTFLARKSGKVSVHRISMFKLNWTENKARDCNWAPHRFGWEQFVCPYILKSVCWASSESNEGRAAHYEHMLQCSSSDTSCHNYHGNAKLSVLSHTRCTLE